MLPDNEIAKAKFRALHNLVESFDIFTLDRLFSLRTEKIKVDLDDLNTLSFDPEGGILFLLRFIGKSSKFAEFWFNFD